MTKPDFSEFQPQPKGNHFEDFQVGQVLHHHWGRTLTESDNTLFVTITHAFTPLYYNAEYARAHDHPGVLIHPLLVLTTVVGLSVEDLSEGGGPSWASTTRPFTGRSTRAIRSPREGWWLGLQSAHSDSFAR